MNAQTPARNIGLKFAGGIALSIVALGGCTLPESEPTDSSTSSTDTSAEEEPAEESNEPDLTAGQENAIGTAQNYIDLGPFSKTGLIKQLKFEKYSSADARFAVNHVDVSWKSEAAESAQNYLDLSSFSRDGLITQLKFEGFTDAQARYGVAKAGL